LDTDAAGGLLTGAGAADAGELTAVGVALFLVVPFPSSPLPL
jgi:hypothetical protein